MLRIGMDYEGVHIHIQFLAVMTTLRALIRNQRVKNDDGHWFIPNGNLDSCLTPTAVYNCLQDCGIDAWNLDEVTTVVIQGAKKVFAVLLLIRHEKDIVRFVEYDGFQNQSLDSRVPLSLDVLRRIFRDAAEEFYEEQWLVTAPIFTKHLTHRYFQDETVLPFTTSRPVGRGGFGQIYDVTIPSGHQRFDNNSLIQATEIHAARKELEVDEELMSQDPTETWHASGASEHRVLSALHHVRNPCILELLASYTHRGKHNLLFPLATSGDLQQFLRLDERPPQFKEDASIYLAVAGLASALETLHTYKSSTTNLEMIGYHHDLNPKNILVNEDRFILSDFGLSKLEVRDDSKTMFKVGRGFYLAPECEELASQFRKGVITRASDIWSFGCILLEVLIFMHYGSRGVQGFRDDRRVQISNFTTRTFFVGDMLNPAVETWIHKLSTTVKTTGMKAINLIKKMLSIRPDLRPKANEVMVSMRLLSVEVLYFLTDTALDSILRKQSTVDVFLEVSRFRAWGSTFDFGAVAHPSLGEDSAATFQHEQIFSAVIAKLKKLRSWAKSIIEPYDPFGPPHYDLRIVNDELFNQLSRLQQQRANQCLEIRLLSSSQSQISLPYREEWPPYLEIGYREATEQIRFLYSDSIDGLEQDLRISRDELREWEQFQACTKAKLFQGKGVPEMPVLVEWIVYDVHWTGERGKALFLRIGSLATLLNKVPASRLFRTLNCKGFFHAAERRAFGLVYELPFSCEETPDLVSLQEIIQSKKDLRQRPPLEKLFELARELSVALLEFHKVGWIHKSLNSYNVVFVRTNAHQELLKDFRIIGFNYSRPNHPNEYTEGAWAHTEESRLYQHPDYLQSHCRYRLEFEYYSFGILLLEIGLWKCLPAMLPKPEADSQTARKMSQRGLMEHLLERWVPLLSPRMGTQYQMVVSICLGRRFDDNSPRKNAKPSDKFMDILLGFEGQVVQALRSCHV
jgi:serine/threonine protein kinase